MATGYALLVVAVLALLLAEFAEWPLDKLAAPMVLAFGVGGGFLVGQAVRK